jgi:predicted aspartyl protease
MLRNKAAVFAALLLLFGAAYAAPAPVVAASDNNDVLLLERLSASAASADERALANGVALALRNRAESARAVLEPLAARAAADRDIRAMALMSLSNMALLQGRYGEAYRAWATAKALLSRAFTTEENQTMDLADVLSAMPPMAVERMASGSVLVTRDLAKLPRVPFSVGGVSVNAIFDSGAGFSTVNETTARRLGLEMLARSTTVGSSSVDAIATRVGIARRLQFGDAVLTNVVFFVLPDSVLSFGNGAYTVEAIIGLPVMAALHRVALVKEASSERLYYGPRPGVGAPPANMILAGTVPIILANAGDAGMRLFLDTGATDSALYASATRDFPALAATAVHQTAAYSGAGGAVQDENALRLPTLRLTIAGRDFTLANLDVRSRIEPGQHGVIGQDLLRQGTGWVIDFDAMGFAVRN